MPGILLTVKNQAPADGARSAPAAGGLNIGLSKFSSAGLGFKDEGGSGLVIQSGFCGLSFPRLGVAGINA